MRFTGSWSACLRARKSPSRLDVTTPLSSGVGAGGPVTMWGLSQDLHP